MLLPQSHAWTPLQKGIIALTVAVSCIAFGLVIYSYERHRTPPMQGLESDEGPGFGFRQITIAKWNKFELGHFPYFYYRDRLLCQMGTPPSISPSGKYAIYQDGPSGKLFLFHRADEKITELTPKFVGVAYPFMWHEDRGTVEAQFEKEHTSMMISLQ